MDAKDTLKQVSFVSFVFLVSPSKLEGGESYEAEIAPHGIRRSYLSERPGGSIDGKDIDGVCVRHNQEVAAGVDVKRPEPIIRGQGPRLNRSEEHTSELQSRQYLVCRLLLEKKKT